MHLARRAIRFDQMQPHVQHGRAAIALHQVRFERLHQPTQHERQRLEFLDRPFELERLLESFFRNGGHQRTPIFSASQTLPVCVLTAKACREIVGRQCREIAERSQTPTAEGGELIRDSGFGIRDSIQITKQCDRQRRYSSGLVARLDDREPGSIPHEQSRCGSRARNRNAHAQSAIGSRPSQLLCNRSGFAKQPRQAAQIQHDLRGAAHLDSRRELTRHLRQHIRRSTFYRRQRTEHRSPHRRYAL